MISHQHKCIFIHIPKCGGTSIESALGHLEGHVGRGGQDHRSLRMLQKPRFRWSVISSAENLVEIARGYRWTHRSHRNPRKGLTVTKQQYQSYFKFSIVRNPWARAYSWYKNVMRDDFHQKDLGITAPIPLADFLQLTVGKGMLRSQLWWIKDFSGKVGLDFLGKFEYLERDFEEACVSMGIEPIVLPHKIKGSSADYREEFDSRAIELVDNFYADDISLFGYSFEK